MAGITSVPVESMKIPGASGWVERTEMTEERLRGAPCFSKMDWKLAGVIGAAGRGSERD